MAGERNQGASDDAFRGGFVTEVSEPPPLTPELIAQIREESARFHDEFMARTASMEMLTAADLKIRIR